MYRYIYIILLIFGTSRIYAQKLTGRITNEENKPLPGATATLKLNRQTQLSNAEGLFSLSLVRLPDTLRVSYTGYETRIIPLNESTDLLTPLAIKLIPLTIMLNEVQINTGYQQIPQERATGSFSSVSNSRFNEQTGTDVLSRLEAVANGLNIDRKSNGGGIMIRGLSTIEGPKSPLIILDNFPYEGDLNNINPNDVESITLLKDAAAASIWGTKAGNGVIVITTRKGGFNRPASLEFNSNFGLSSEPDLYYLQQMKSSDFIDVESMLFSKGYYNSQENSVSRPPLTPVVELLIARRDKKLSAEAADAQIDALRPLDIRNDFQRYFYSRGIRQQYSAQLNGGSQHVAWLYSAGYDHNLNELSAGYKRLNLRAENTFKISEKLRASVRLAYTNSKSISGKPGIDEISSINGKLPPYTRLAGPDGEALSVMKNYRTSYLETAGGGKLLDWNYYPLEDYLHSRTAGKLGDLNANLGINYNIIKGLDASLLLQYEKQDNKSENLQDMESYSARNIINQFTQISGSSVKRIVPPGAILDRSEYLLISGNGRAQLNYTMDKGKHAIASLAGAELRHANTLGNSNRTYGYDPDILSSAAMDYANTYPTFVTGGSAYIADNSRFSDKLNRFVSYFVNAAYTYDDKYTFSLSGRRDASNLFGLKTNDKWNPLYSAGLAWTISNEPFYKMAFIPWMKFRATYGVSGNVDPGMAAVTTIRYSATSPYTQSSYASIANYNNPDLRWEKTHMLNVAIDFRALNNRISGSLEYFRKYSRDLFGNEQIDYTAGAGNLMKKNVASIQAGGLDLELNSRNTIGKLSWNTNLFMNFYRDKVTSYYRSSSQGSNYLQGNVTVTGIEGKPVYALFSYRWAGLDPLTGDPQGIFEGALSKNYGDLTGAATRINDLVYHGPAFPTLSGAVGNTLNWRNLSFTARLSYKFGYYFRKPTIEYGSLFATRRGHSDFERRWQKPGDELNTQVPSMVYPAAGNRDSFYSGSEVNVEKGDHIRLQYINVNYGFGKNSLKKLPYKQLNIYVAANNLGLIWAANKAELDPDYAQLPPLKNFSVGLRAGF